MLQVNDIDLRQATHDEAVGVLRLTTQRVSLRVFRHQEVSREEDLWDLFSLELRPRPGEGLGLTTVGKWYVPYAGGDIRVLKSCFGLFYFKCHPYVFGFLFLLSSKRSNSLCPQAD